MNMNSIQQEIVRYLEQHGRTELDVLIENVDANPNEVYGYAKHLKWDGKVEASSGNKEWWIP